MRALLGTVVAGLLYPLIFPPFALWALAWVCLVPLLVALRQVRWRGGGILLASLWTAIWCAGTVGWLPATLADYWKQPWAVGLAGASSIVVLTGALEYAVFATCVGCYGWVHGALRPLVIATAWVGAELSRAKLLSGNPWALLGYSQTPVPELLQIADVTGVYGVSFVVVLANAALAEAWLAVWVPARERWRALAGVVFAGLAVGGSWAYGRAALASAVLPADAKPVLVVQTDVEVHTQWNREVAARNLRRYLALTDEGLAKAPDTAVVFWPEHAITFHVDRDPLAITMVAETLRAHGAQLVTGAPRARPDGQPPHNAALLFDATARLRGWQDKRFLLPFVEYFPAGGETLLRRGFDGARTTTPGRIGASLRTTVGPAGVLVCNESLFPEAARELVGAGAQYLVNLANDSWPDSQAYALEAFEVVRLRAVEQRRYLVRAATSGPSGIVDPWGRTVASTPAGVAATVTGTVAARAVRTRYASYGDWFAYGCALLAMGCAIVGWGTGRV